MKRTTVELADGRELIYFDERDDAVRKGPDRRQLPPPPPASQLRYDPLVDEWVAIAAHRQTRTFLPPSDECPLCPSTPERSTEIPAYDYDVAVFENRFPSFSDRATEPAGELTPLSPTRPGAGRCEVVCFTADHDSSFARLQPPRVRTVLDALADRTTALSGLPGVEQVFCFENRGVEIGVTLHHPHGQIYAYPFVTPRTRAMLAAARRHADRTGGANLYADVLSAERAAGDRVVAGNEHLTAYVPAAARWPFEVHLAPHRPVPDIPALDDAERDAFGPLYLDLLRRFDGLFHKPEYRPEGIGRRETVRPEGLGRRETVRPEGLGRRETPYISAWHQAPVRVDRELGHLHLQLFSIRRAADKLKYLAGSESAMDVFINDIAPERAADLLRQAG